MTTTTPAESRGDLAAMAGPQRRSLARDTAIVLARELRPVLHDPFSVLFSLVQPIFFLALFGPLLAGNLGDGLPGAGLPGGGAPGGGVWQWFVPGIIVMISLFGSSMVGSNLLYEMQTGAHERMLVTPLSRPALLLGRAAKEIVTLTAQAVVIVVVMLPFGFRLFPAGALLGLVLLATLGVGVSSLSYALAVAVSKQDWMFWTVQQTFLFPLLILSGMLLPLEGAPGWMQALAKANPLTYVVDAERLLFAGRIADSGVLWGFLAAGATALLGLALGIRAMRRSD